VSNGYAHWGVPQTGTWGAMTAPMGARTDMAIHRCRTAVAGVLNVLTPAAWEVTADPSARQAERARARA
jgi:hypothetical protein